MPDQLQNRKFTLRDTDLLMILSGQHPSKQLYCSLFFKATSQQQERLIGPVGLPVLMTQEGMVLPTFTTMSPQEEAAALHRELLINISQL